MRNILSVLLAIVLVAVGILIYDNVSQQTPEEKKAELVALMGGSDGKYDKSHEVANLVGFNSADLENYQRAILIEGLYEGKVIHSVKGLALVLDDGYVIASTWLFIYRDQFFTVALWQYPVITLKAYLLPDTRKEDTWQKEELGNIYIIEDAQFAVIERTDPVLNVKAAKSLGNYEELSNGDALYVLSQENGRISAKYAKVFGVYTDREGRNLFSFTEGSIFNELGDAAFAIRDGKPELVGFLTFFEQIDGLPENAYIHFLDINQIVGYAKKAIKK